MHVKQTPLRRDTETRFWPTSRAGRLSVGALATFALGLAGLFTAAALGKEGGETFSDNWWLAGPALAASLAALDHRPHSMERAVDLGDRFARRELDGGRLHARGGHLPALTDGPTPRHCSNGWMPFFPAERETSLHSGHGRSLGSGQRQLPWILGSSGVGPRGTDSHGSAGDHHEPIQGLPGGIQSRAGRDHEARAHSWNLGCIRTRRWGPED